MLKTSQIVAPAESPAESGKKGFEIYVRSSHPQAGPRKRGSATLHKEPGEDGGEMA